MRDDLSDKLVHLTRGEPNAANPREQAVARLNSVLAQRLLAGGTGYIKGAHRCVCFSEAPIGKLSHLLAENDHRKFKYQPYGVLVDKKWLYRRGGRPVIYGADADYDSLPEAMKYRHVRMEYEVPHGAGAGTYDIDFTWEREWRIKTDALPIAPEEVTIVVPDRPAKDVFAAQWKDANWHFIVLSDLGVRMSAP